jgi:hypothetical protein
VEKIHWVLQSRKFWAAVISLLTALGVLNWSDAQQAETVAMLAAGIGAAYSLAVALEDGLSARAMARWFDAEGDE